MLVMLSEGHLVISNGVGVVFPISVGNSEVSRYNTKSEIRGMNLSLAVNRSKLPMSETLKPFLISSLMYCIFSKKVRLKFLAALILAGMECPGGELGTSML